MTDNQFLQQKREREFQQRVLAAVEKPSENRFWAALNKPFTIWALSLFILTVGGSYFTMYQQCQRDAFDEIARFNRIHQELRERESQIRRVIHSSKTVKDLRAELAAPFFYHPEFRDYPTRLVRDVYGELTRRIIGFGHPTFDRTIAKFYPIANGILPDWLTDDHLVELRKISALPLMLDYMSGEPPRQRLFQSSGIVPLRSACGPLRLWNRLTLGLTASVVETYDILKLLGFGPVRGKTTSPSSDSSPPSSTPQK